MRLTGRSRSRRPRLTKAVRGTAVIRVVAVPSSREIPRLLAPVVVAAPSRVLRAARLSCPLVPHSPLMPEPTLSSRSMRIAPATAKHLPAIRAAYADARAIQRSQGAEVWLEFPDAAILAEINAGHLFRVL